MSADALTHLLGPSRIGGRRLLREALNPTTPAARARVLHVIGKLNVGGATLCAIHQAATTHLFGYPAAVACRLEGRPEGDLYEVASQLRTQLLIMSTLGNRPRPLADSAALSRLAGLIELAGYSILHSHGWKGHMIAAILKRKLPRLKLLHQVHGWSWPTGARDLRSRALIATTRWAAKATDIFGVVTTQDIQKGLSLGIGRGEEYVVIRSGINPSDFPAATPQTRRRARRIMGIPDGARVVGSVGRLQEQKAPLRFVRAVAELRHHLDNVTAVWIGDGPLRRHMQREIHRLHVGDVVKLAGSRDDVPRLLPGFDVFVLASRYEGMPRSVLEALAVGIPVVCTRNDGIIELASMPETDGAMRVVGPDELAPAVLEALASPRRIRPCKPITVEDTVLQTVAAYEALTDGFE